MCRAVGAADCRVPGCFTGQEGLLPPETLSVKRLSKELAFMEGCVNFHVCDDVYICSQCLAVNSAKVERLHQQLKNLSFLMIQAASDLLSAGGLTDLVV